MQPFRLHVPSLPPAVAMGELTHVILGGISRNHRTVLWDDIESADLVVYDFRHFQHQYYDEAFAHKSVIVDYQDNAHSILSQTSALYFKRSIVDRETKSLVKYQREVDPIAYFIRNDYLNHIDSGISDRKRDIDIAAFFDPNEDIERARNRYRATVAQTIKTRFPDRNVFAGVAGEKGPAGRNHFQTNYFDIMQRSKIVVTCNPDRWEGDYRLFESLASGAMVMVDTMLTPVIHPFVDDKHLVYFDRENMDTLIKKIQRLLDRPEQCRAIAASGLNHALKYHKTENRIDEILTVAQQRLLIGSQ
ncbi:MAG: glycosyltransferase [Pseudomonadota bacterium]